MKTIAFRVLAFVALLLMLGCEQNFEFGDKNFEENSKDELIKQRSVELNWKEQLQRIIDVPPTILKQSDISLLGYELVDVINDDMKIEKYKQAIINDNNMMPYYMPSLKTIKAITKKEAVSTRSSYQTFNLSGVEKYIKNKVQKDMKVIRLKWNNNGTPTNTLCLVSEQEGIVYDNFVTNTIVLKTPKISCYAMGSNDGIETPKLKTRTEPGGSSFTGRMIWTLEEGANWIWGSERGSVTITHEGHYANGKFYYHNFYVNHYFNLGNSDAKVAEVKYNTIAYGYGFSTIGISISLTLTGGSYKLTFGTMVGSTGGGTGHHTHSDQL